MQIILTACVLIPVGALVVYFVCRFIIGHKIAQCMKAFHGAYDAHITEGKTKSEAFSKAVEIFKKCEPYNRLSDEDWDNINNTFPVFDDPKKAFLRVMLQPSTKVMKYFKNPKFFEDLLAAKNK